MASTAIVGTCPVVFYFENMANEILPDLPFQSADFAVKWSEWMAFRKENRWPTYKPIGLKNALKDLIELSNNDEVHAIAIIDQSLRKGWRGFFKLKDNGSNTKHTTTETRKQSLISGLS